MTGIAAASGARGDDPIAILQRAQHAIRPRDHGVALGDAARELLVGVVRKSRLDLDALRDAAARDEHVALRDLLREVLLDANRLDRGREGTLSGRREDLGAARHAGAEVHAFRVREPDLYREAQPL